MTPLRRNLIMPFHKFRVSTKKQSKAAAITLKMSLIDSTLKLAYNKRLRTNIEQSMARVVNKFHDNQF